MSETAHLLRLLEAHETRQDDLRTADRHAVALAHQDLKERLEGFPELFATKDEMTAMRDAVTRLDKEAINREVYDSHQQTLELKVATLVRDKLDEAVFLTFVENQRIKDEEAAKDRRDVAAALARATERKKGQSATWAQIGGVIAGVVGFMTIMAVIVTYLSAS